MNNTNTTMIVRSQRVCAGGEIIPADIAIEHDFIQKLLPHGSVTDPAVRLVDAAEMLVVPGFIDFHSDSIEREVEPRPGATFPLDNAMIELDKKLAMAGITTIFHAVSFNDEALTGQRGTAVAEAMIRRISAANRSELTIDNLIHARYEITSFSSVAVIEQLLEEELVQLLSFMDHTPGQGQYRNLEKWLEGHSNAFDVDERRAREIVAIQQEKKPRCLEYMKELAESARKKGVILASHDDDSPEKVDLMASLGVCVAEFPLNTATARYAAELNIASSMGAPNVVRGRSQNGNISARELITGGCCDFLCSDYHPSSMLQAVYALHQQENLSLVASFDYVTRTPAKAGGLNDRGDIAAGKLADLVIIDDRRTPRVEMTLKSGLPVYNGRSCLCF